VAWQHLETTSTTQALATSASFGATLATGLLSDTIRNGKAPPKVTYQHIPKKGASRPFDSPQYPTTKDFCKLCDKAV